MQGERASLGSLSEALNFEHGSTSSNAVIDQQMCWENIHSLGDNGLQNYMISSADTNTTYANSVYHGQQDLHRFSLGEASSSGTKNEVASHDEQRPELGRFEEGRNESIDLNTLFVRSSSSTRAPRNVNLNAEFIEHPGDMTQVMSHPGLFDTNGVIPLQAGRDFEENSCRAGSSLEGRRASCKRKALEGNISQSSPNGGFREFQRGESSSWTRAPAYYNPGSGMNLPGSLDQGSRGLVSGVPPNFPAPAIAESSSRNLCIRVNPSDQQETVNPAVFSAGSVVRRPVAPTLSNSSRLLPAEKYPIDLRHGQALGNNTVSQNPNARTLRMPPILVPPFSWSGGPVPGGSSGSVAPVERNVIQRDESRSRNISRNILENPLFVPAPELRNLSRSQINRNITSGNPNIAGNVASSSRTSSSAGVQPSPSNAAWTPYQSNLPHYQRRFSELVRRSLLSSHAVDGPNQRAGDHTTLHSLVPSASADELLLQSGGDNSQANTRAYSRSAHWFERHGDGVIGIPHPLRVLASSRGRSRLVASEIRNVLDLMRRGENVRFEDVMLLDQSMLLGVADIHDRYRDMRLDVDNMSYEELLALEERMGDVCTGLNEETISNRLKQRRFESSIRSLNDAEPCCVCQEEYNEGEDVGTLECGHDFHSHCIKEWLKRKNICPICKTTGLNTSYKPTG